MWVVVAVMVEVSGVDCGPGVCRQVSWCVPAGALMVVAVSSVDYGKNRGAEKEKESEMQKGAECGEGKGISCNFVSGAGNES